MTETTVVRGPLTRDELTAIDAWWRAANYLSVGQIYLLGNPLLAEPLRPEHVKPRLLGHWGTTPGLNLIYAHLNRVITAHDLDVIYVCGPGQGRARQAVQAVLVPRRHPVARGAGDAGVDPRGRRARLLAPARLRGRVRQPRADRGLRDRRRRGGDRAAGRKLARQQVPRPGARPTSRTW
jgi:hypothetical protein